LTLSLGGRGMLEDRGEVRWIEGQDGIEGGEVGVRRSI
jgi:hypothetical protein